MPIVETIGGMLLGISAIGFILLGVFDNTSSATENWRRLSPD